MLNAAARVVSGTRKFDHGLSLTQLRHPELHWLDVPVCIQYKLGVTVLSTWWTAVTYFGCRQPSASSLWQLIFPRHRRSKFGRRAFSVVGPMTWNCLHDNLYDSMLCDEKFRAAFKTHFSPVARTLIYITNIVLYKCSNTYLLSW